MALPNVKEDRGDLTYIEGARHIPFEIMRVYHVYDVPEGGARGGHAHRTLQQFLIAARGSFDVVVDDGKARQSFHLSDVDGGLYMPAMIWRELTNFSPGAVCLVLASKYYDETDYFHDYDVFQKAARIGA
jgi:dTDP-4-dehydrorhamnose 3,5-epimerase-like enzyme